MCNIIFIIFNTFISYPQGGGISLFSMLPIMLLSIFYGPTTGVTGGLIFGLLKLLNGAFIIHPVQFLLDCILANMAFGLAGILGNDTMTKNKYRFIYCCSFKCFYINNIRCCIFWSVCTKWNECMDIFMCL